MKHCTLPTLLAVKTTILPTVPSSRAGQKLQNSETGKMCIAAFFASRKFNLAVNSVEKIFCFHLR